MAQIISIVKKNDVYHPAVGYSYIVELSDGRKGEATDDMFLGMFEELREVEEVHNDRDLLGKTWDEDYNLF